MEHPIGTCSLCGGTVVKETGPYWSVVPPVGHCLSCGATEGPPQMVIQMTPQRAVATMNRLREFAEKWNSAARPIDKGHRHPDEIFMNRGGLA